MIDQNYRRILHYQFSPGSEIQEIQCRIPRKDLRSDKYPQLVGTKKQSDELVEFKSQGKVYYTSSGRVFGWLKPNE